MPIPVTSCIDQGCYSDERKGPVSGERLKFGHEDRGMWDLLRSQGVPDVQYGV